MIQYVFILLGINILVSVILLIKVFKREDVVIPYGKEIIFKQNGEVDWVIKKANHNLITGIKSGGTIIKKSTI